MEIDFTPRFHQIGEAKKNNLFIEERPKKERHTSKNLSTIKQLRHKCYKKVNKHKRFKSYKHVNNILSQKFILRNDFDKEHCKMFLKEKYECLEEPILFDEICI